MQLFKQNSVVSYLIETRILSGGIWVLSGKICLAFFGLLTNALLARLLSPEEMGAYFLTLSIVSLSAMFSSMGLNRSIVRLVAESIGLNKYGSARVAIVKTLKIAVVASSVVAALFFFGFGKWLSINVFHSRLIQNVIGIAALWIIVQTSQGIISDTFRGFNYIWLATVFGGLIRSFLASMFFAVLWIYQGHSNLSEVLIFALAAGTTSVAIASLILRNKLSNRNVDTTSIGFREIIRISIPMWITTLGIFALVQADLWILGAFRTQSEVAVYGVALKFVGLMAMPLFVAEAVVPPLIARLYALGKRKELEKSLRLTSSLAVYPTFFMLLGLLLFAEQVLRLLYGQFYGQGASILRLLCLGQAASVYAGCSGFTLMMCGYEKHMMTISITCGLLNLIGCLLVVKLFGPIGLAMVASGTLIFQNILMLAFTKRYVGVWTHATANPLSLLKTEQTTKMANGA